MTYMVKNIDILNKTACNKHNIRQLVNFDLHLHKITISCQIRFLGDLF